MATYIAGAYTVEWDSLDLGQTEVGFQMVMRPSFIPIRADETGRTPIDGIFTGVEDIIIRLQGIEFTSAIWQKMTAWAYESNTEGLIQKAGILMSTIAKTLTLTPVTGAAVAIYTFDMAYPLEPLTTIFSSQRLRSGNPGFYCFAEAVVSQVPRMYEVD